MHVRTQVMYNLGNPYCPIGFWLELWFLFDGESTQTFFNRSDCFDNAQLATDLGYHPYFFYREIWVTPQSYPELYKKGIFYVLQSSEDN